MGYVSRRHLEGRPPTHLRPAPWESTPLLIGQVEECPRCGARIRKLIRRDTQNRYWVDADAAPHGRWEWLTGTVSVIPATDATEPLRRMAGHRCPRSSRRAA